MADIFTGPRARLILDGRVVGYCTDCSGSEEVMYEPIEVLDNIEVKEHAPVGYRVSFRAGLVYVLNNSLKGSNMNVFPKTGPDADVHLLNILNKGEFVIQLLDAVNSSTVMMTLEGARIASHSFNIGSRASVSQDVVFVARRMKDESE